MENLPSAIPVNERVVQGHNAEGKQVVPAVAHGDEHDVVHVILVPFRCPKRRKEHKSNLVG